jgi:uncharacterized protein
MISVNVAGLLHEPPGATRELPIRDHYVSLGPDLELAGPLNGRLRLQRTNRGILVRGRVSAPLRRTCARCLEPYVEETTVPIDEEFLPTLDVATGAPQPDEESDALRIDDHHEIELGEVIREELALTEPMHPLCRPDCQGLCPECGERLTAGPHDHGADEVDPRLAALASLLDKRTEE